MTGQSRDSAVQVLAQVGHPVYEVPLGPTIPAYYGLLASRHMHEFGSTEADFAELAVLMRRHAAAHDGAQFREPISVDDVLASRPIATPLKMLDCCPVSDGGCAFVIAAEPQGAHPVRIASAAQHHNAQHVSAAASLTDCGAGACTSRALATAGRKLADVEAAAIYDSFTITLAMLLEEIGLAPRGRAGVLAREGHFSAGGPMPLNLHGGLLSYGHCGVGGAMAHLAEMHLQMTGRAGRRQARRAGVALLHGDGGVLSSHVSLVLEGA
jgi:acetyl-CoA acetyltransferase